MVFAKMAIELRDQWWYCRDTTQSKL